MACSGHTDPDRSTSTRSPAADAVRPARTTGRCLIVLALGCTLTLSAPLTAQGAFGPDGASWVVNEGQNFTQKQGRISADPDLERLSFAWHSSLNLNDVWARLYDVDGTPLTGDLMANASFGIGIQDEPDVALGEGGNTFIAWSDRAAFDGDNMGIAAVVLDAFGVPLGPEFVVNQTWVASQWEPLIQPMPGGGFVIAWSGNNDGDAYIRVYDDAGLPLTPEIEVNTLGNNAQIDTVAAASGMGTVFTVWVDHGGHGPGSGTNLFGRVYDELGNALQSAEFLIHETVFEGAQREPRLVGDRMGRFLLVWEDHENDGDGRGIYARRFDALGAPLGPEFLVNATVTAGDQFAPNVAVDWLGNAVILFEDDSTGSHRVLGQRIDRHDQPMGAAFVVSNNTLDGFSLPDVVMDQAYERMVLAWTGNGSVGSSPKQDIFAQPYRFEPITVGGTPAPGQSFTLDLDLPGGDFLDYILLGSLSTDPGIPLPKGRELALTTDLLFSLTLNFPNAGVFVDFQGSLDGNGRATAQVNLPALPEISGLTMHFAAISLDSSEPTFPKKLRHVTDPVAVTIQ